MMPYNQHCVELGEDAAVDIFAALMIDRFGAHAAAVAIDQLTAARAKGGAAADRWLLIVMSIEDRPNTAETDVLPAVRQSTAKRA